MQSSLIKIRLAALPKPQETEWELELPEEQQVPNGEVELSEEDAAERDRRNKAIQEAKERAEFKRQTQVIQKELPRPRRVDIDALLKAVSDSPDLIDGAIAKETVLLIANDALKFPLPGTKVHGKSKKLEAFDDAALERARQEIAKVITSEALRQQQEGFELACEEADANSVLPGLSGYEDDESDEHQLMIDAFKVSFHSHALHRICRLTNDPFRELNLPFWLPPKKAKILKRNLLSIWVATKPVPKLYGRRLSKQLTH